MSISICLGKLDHWFAGVRSSARYAALGHVDHVMTVAIVIINYFLIIF